MNIELRLKSLEARKSIKNGVFVVTVNDGGKASLVTKKGKVKTFDSLENAKAVLYEKYCDPIIIIIDVGGKK